MVNRAAVLLRYKEPAVAWINEVDPTDHDTKFTLEQVNQERTVYLISEEDSETSDMLRRWIKRNHAQLFENELASWYVNKKVWPQKRDFNMFQAWFEVECHTVLIDTVGSEICDEEE